jgi:16S rRNA (guanine966-N2)-methyltransferase
VGVKPLTGARLTPAAKVRQSGATGVGTGPAMARDRSGALSSFGQPDMRVIAGEHRGRRLAAPRGRTTRPTPDRVREAVFSALESRLGGPGSLAQASVLDLYAGTGALGIEALSRGARQAVFAERDAAALAGLRENLAALGLGARALVLAGDATGALARLAAGGQRFDAVFLDPPYEGGEGAKALAAVAAAGVVRPGGVIVLEHAAREAAPEAPGLAHEPTRRYGTVSITFYSPAAAPAPAAPLPTEDAP